MAEYAVIKTGSNEIATFTVDINGGNVRLLAVAGAGDTISVKVQRMAMTV
jgi:tryptophan synthase beta subunit